MRHIDKKSKMVSFLLKNNYTVCRYKKIPTDLRSANNGQTNLIKQQCTDRKTKN